MVSQRMRAEADLQCVAKKPFCLMGTSGSLVTLWRCCLPISIGHKPELPVGRVQFPVASSKPQQGTPLRSPRNSNVERQGCWPKEVIWAELPRVSTYRLSLPYVTTADQVSSPLPTSTQLLPEHATLSCLPACLFFC